MSIIIGGDVVPTESNVSLFQSRNIHRLIGDDLKRIMDEADYRIINLEVPLCNHPQPIEKIGPNLIAPTSSVNGLKEMGIDLCVLANNHIKDQDIKGIKSTCYTLDKARISYVGVGNNLGEASKPFFFYVKRKRYGVYACTEHEFSTAGKNSPGANPFDLVEIFDQVRQSKVKSDYLIVLYHGGKEHYRYPSPNLQKTCRKLIKSGADLVICQHSHCIGCEEKYKNGTIVYGQGNFIFDRYNNEYWNSSLLLHITDELQIEYIPLCKNNETVRLATGENATEIMSSFKKRSKEIEIEGFIETTYDEYAKNNITDYLLWFSGKKTSVLFRIINKVTGYQMQKLFLNHYKKRVKKGLLNYIECEAHRELIITALKDNDI